MFASSIRNLVLLCAVLLLQALNAQNLSDVDLAKIRFIEKQPSTGNYFSFSADKKNEVDTAIIWLNGMFTNPAFSQYKAWLHYQRGRLHYLRKEIDRAQIDLEAALNLEPMHYEALERLSTMSYHHLKNYTKRRIYINNGIAAYEAKLAEDSANASLWYYYAKFLDLDNEFSNAKNNQERITAWQQCVLYDSTIADAWYELSYLHTNEPNKRLAYLYTALSLQEYWLYRSHILATLKFDIGDNDRTLAFLNESIAVYESRYPSYKSTLSGYYKDRAAIYGKLKQFDLQQADLLRVKELE